MQHTVDQTETQQWGKDTETQVSLSQLISFSSHFSIKSMWNQIILFFPF